MKFEVGGFRMFDVSMRITYSPTHSDTEHSSPSECSTIRHCLLHHPHQGRYESKVLNLSVSLGSGSCLPEMR